MAQIMQKKGFLSGDQPNFKNNILFLDQAIDNTIDPTFLENPSQRMWGFFAREKMHNRLWRKVQVYTPPEALCRLAPYDFFLQEAIKKNQLKVETNKAGQQAVNVQEAITLVFGELEKKRLEFSKEKKYMEYDALLDVLYSLIASQFRHVPYMMPLKSKAVRLFKSEDGPPEGLIIPQTEDIET